MYANASFGVLIGRKGLPMKYTREILEEAVKNSTSFCDVARKFNKRGNGGSLSYLIGLIRKLEIPTQHFLTPSEISRKSCKNRKSYKDILILRSKDYKESWLVLRRGMIEYGFEYYCSKCGLGNSWQNESIVLEIDHINGNSLDNCPENLRFLCPNCHSQTKTYCRSKSYFVKQDKICEDCDKKIHFQSKRCRNCASKKNNVHRSRLNNKKLCCDCNQEISRYSTRCKSCVQVYKHRNISKRPNKEILQQDVDSMSMVKVGKKYGVTDNAVRRWIKFYIRRNEWRN